MSFDDLLKNAPKMLQMADDLNRMADYINELRLLTFVLAGTGYLAGIMYGIWWCCLKDKTLTNRTPLNADLQHHSHHNNYYDDGYGMHNGTLLNGRTQTRTPVQHNNNNGYGSYAALTGKHTGNGMANGDLTDGFREPPTSVLEELSARRESQFTNALPSKDPNNVPSNV